MNIGVLASLYVLAAAPTAGAFQWNVPGVVGEIDVPGATRVPGGEVTLHTWYSKSSRFELLKHFATQFLNAGFWIAPIPPKRRSALEPQLTAVDPRTLRVYSVLLVPAKGAIAVTTEITDPRGNDRVTALDIPLPKDATSIVRSAFEGGETVVFESRQDPKRLEAFFSERLKAKGYRQELDGSFTTRRRELRVEVHAAESAGAPNHVVVMDHRGSSGGPE